MIVNKKIMFIGFALGSLILIVITRSWGLAAILIPTLLFIWWLVRGVKKFNSENKGKFKRKKLKNF